MRWSSPCSPRLRGPAQHLVIDPSISCFPTAALIRLQQEAIAAGFVPLRRSTALSCAQNGKRSDRPETKRRTSCSMQRLTNNKFRPPRVIRPQMRGALERWTVLLVSCGRRRSVEKKSADGLRLSLGPWPVAGVILRYEMVSKS
jgi:hypothetical protein